MSAGPPARRADSPPAGWRIDVTAELGGWVARVFPPANLAHVLEITCWYSCWGATRMDAEREAWGRAWDLLERYGRQAR